MDVKYRDFEIKDKETIINLIDELQKFASNLDPIKRATWKPGFGEYVYKEMVESFEKYNGKCVVAVVDNTLVGYLWGLIPATQSPESLLSVIPSKLGVLKDAYINEKYRGQHIGSTLIEKMETYFKEQGCDAVWLQVFVPNKSAYNLYKKLGYLERDLEMLKNI
ncbi:MAG: Acetyltransferase [uncultured bacterium]|nr:MAG: Acetyltransferase [uncultured bacterium]